MRGLLDHCVRAVPELLLKSVVRHVSAACCCEVACLWQRTFAPPRIDLDQLVQAKSCALRSVRSLRACAAAHVAMFVGGGSASVLSPVDVGVFRDRSGAAKHRISWSKGALLLLSEQPVDDCVAQVCVNLGLLVFGALGGDGSASISIGPNEVIAFNARVEVTLLRLYARHASLVL